MAVALADLDPYRLPTEVVPHRYDVRLRPDLRTASFRGRVTVLAEVVAPTEHVVLNAAELDIVACRIDGEDVGWRLDAPTERLVLTSPKQLDAGQVRIDVEFSGTLSDKLRGFYRSTYVDADGVEQVIATTQMQATDCRRAFPCWDEPEFKAVFGVTLDVAAGLTAISNGPEIERTVALDDAGERSVIRFADTMPMSSYLVAFVVGRLEATEPIDVDGVPLRVVHVPGKSHLTAFGLDVGAACLRWFQNYYGIPYPSDKVDLIALPDFAAGAMENLGCITFRESLLLVDPATSTQNEQQLVADVVAHELAHMWFGDLVTMRWWNGIWLNEAFATFMEIAACDAYRPDWQRWTSFGLERSVAFETDSLTTTRPVEYEVRSPADCEGMFDVLTYQKGGALLRMLEQYLGAERFRAGVAQYLRTHSYRNTETSDLWDAIETTSGEPVRRIMDSWIWQPGYPLVSASVADGRLRLSQRRFLFAEDASTPDAAVASWVIPIHVRNAGTTSTVLLDGDSVDVALVDPDGAVIVNAGGHGFYRVAYDDELLCRLDAEALATTTTLERYNLVDDAWSAAISGRLPATALLGFLRGFADETQHAVWQAVVIALRGLGRLVDDPEARTAFQEQVRDLVGPARDRLGEPVQGEADLTRKLRGLLTATLGVLGADEVTIARCRERFAAASAEPASVEAELTAAATSVVAAHGDVATYERMLAAFRHAPTPQDQLRHLYALAEFDDPDLIDRTCALATSAAVKTQNAPFLLRAAIANRNHGPRAWTFVRRHWDEVNERFPSNTIVRMVDSVKLLTDPDVVADVQAFFAEHPIQQARKTMEQVLERQRVNAAFAARDRADLEGALGGDRRVEVR